MSINQVHSLEQPNGHGDPVIRSLHNKVGQGKMLDAGWEAMRLMMPQTSKVNVQNVYGNMDMNVERRGFGPLDTDFGSFWHGCYNTGDRWGDYHALIACDDIDTQTGQPIFKNTNEIFLRTDSGCITGQVFHDRTCDCRQQLHIAMQEVTTRGEGIIVHIPGQDGRGMGLPFKLGTLHIQKRLGADTIQAGTLLRFTTEVQRSVSELIGLGELDKAKGIMDQAIGLEVDAEALWDSGHYEKAVELIDAIRVDIAEIMNEVRSRLRISDLDQRTYEGVIATLKVIGIHPGTKINMATNNPHKMDVFRRNGYPISHTPVLSPNSSEIAGHLQAKAKHMGHVIPVDAINQRQ